MKADKAEPAGTSRICGSENRLGDGVHAGFGGASSNDDVSQHERALAIYAARVEPTEDAGDVVGAGVGAGPARTALHRGDDRSVLDAYVSATRGVPLLSKEEEVVLGREMRESRAALATTIACIPGAVERFLDALDSAAKGHRPLTDAVLTPFGNIVSEDGESVPGPPGKGSTRAVPPWRPLAETLAGQFARWRRLARERGPASAEALERAQAMGATLCEIEPAAVVLAEMLDELDESCRRIVSLRVTAQARRAVARPRGGRVRLNAAERRALESIESSLGVSARQLESAVAEATAQRRRYDAARQHMVKANLRLAFHMARKLAGNGVAFEDLVQEAILGLMRAAEKFDPSLGYKFSTYASQWIWQGITRAVADGSRTIRVAAHMHDTIIRLNKLSRSLQQDLGRDPTLNELADESGLSPGRVAKALDSSRQPLSLDAPLAGHEDMSLGATIEDEFRPDPMDETLDEEVTSEVRQLLEVLPPREGLILRLRHGIGVAEPYTLEEIGKVLGITRERTRQLEARAMERLREEVDPRLASALSP